MCDPLTIGAGLSAAQLGLNYMGGQAQYASDEARYAANAKNVAQSTALNYEANQLEILQTRESAGVEKEAIGREALAARGSSQAAAGDAGVTGLSVDALVRDVYAQEGRATDAVDQNAGFREQSASIDRQNIAITGRSQIQSVSRGTRPSLAGSLLQLGGIGTSYYMQRNSTGGP